MKRDIFPRTRRTWIDRQLDEGAKGRSSVNRHIMDVYAGCLRVWYLGSSYRSSGDPEDVISGFFADRLARESFLGRWRSSEKRLRHWLINAFHFYLKEQRRAQSRDQRWRPLPDEVKATQEPPSRSIDRAFAASLVRRACQDVKEICESKGQEAYWEVFLGHHVDGEPYRDAGARHGVSAEKAAIMARTAERRFVRALRGLLERDGTSSEGVELEIEELLEAVRS